MTATAKLQRSFDQKITNALQVSEFLEQGQADMPLTQLFLQLRKELNQRPFSISLLCLTDDSRKAALKWLYGHNFAVFSVQISSQVGLLEVHLKDRGYSVEKSTGERLDFDQWEDMVTALDDKGLIDGVSPTGEIRIGTQSATAIKQLNVLMPESTEFIQQSPALITRLLRESNVLMVAAPPNYSLGNEQASIINTLLEDMSCFIPLLPINELDDIGIPSHSWWEQLKASASLPVQLLTTHVDANLPSFLTDPNDEIRQALQLQQLSKKYQSACDAVGDQFDDALRQLNSRKKREIRKQQPTPTGSKDNQLMRLRSRIGEACSDLYKATEDANRKRELINSDTAVDLIGHVDTLTKDDLKKEDGYKVVKLTLNDSYQKELMNFMRTNTRRALDSDIEEIKEALKYLVDDFCQTLNKQLGYRPTIKVPTIDRSEIWHELEQILAMEVRYQGEMPKQGFFQRLGAGRQALMALMMAGMVLGSFIDRKVLMLFGFPLFLMGIIYSYIRFPKEEAARLEKEIKRVRDEVLNNSRRLSTDINRQKLNRFRDILDKLKKSWIEQIENIITEFESRNQLELRKQADTARQRIQGIEQKVAEFQVQKMNLNKLHSGANQLISEVSGELKNVAS